ncbi:hypothetical protein C475_05040 [Halosimplex carlsbadense 2-9-1]|uniref:DUF2270 domain-containing protein n=1 Tax=Halosimplex carlsbadense 2-9-1 TaxID=797114 RepID=M0CZU4_9EURY|nr:DUF2270 domain-containing protein [Halosimplex carlsbadense]ELZ28143.1 hypothetical protein C475_05040 [Halosimplex carlsbadense 2-9-1]
MSDRTDDGDPSTRDDLSDRIDESLPTLLGHLYRGEMNRANTWRDRLDRTTNWAVTIIAALLTFVFSGRDNPHYLLILGMGLVAVFHLVDTRRYIAYDVWRSRVRLLEEDVFAAGLDRESGATHDDWRDELGEDLRRPARKTPFGEGYARRLRRVYLPLLLVLLAAWVVRITVFTRASDPLAAASIVMIPGSVVAGAVALGYLAAAAFAYWPRQRRSMGEFYDREKEGEWKTDGE